MQLPRFTKKSALVYLTGVAAVLLLVYLLIALTLRGRPRKAIQLQPAGTAMMLLQ